MTRRWPRPGRDLLYVLAPCPNLEAGQINWAARGDAYAHEMLATAAQRLLPDWTVTPTSSMSSPRPTGLVRA